MAGLPTIAAGFVAILVVLRLIFGISLVRVMGIKTIAMLNKNTVKHPSNTHRWSCAHCGACCRHAGEVRLRADEIEPIARFLDMPINDFTAAFASLHADRSGLILNEAEDGACIFLKDNLCHIQPVKPRQCRDFPGRWQIPGFESFCRAQRRSE